MNGDSSAHWCYQCQQDDHDDDDHHRRAEWDGREIWVSVVPENDDKDVNNSVVIDDADDVTV